MPLKSTSSLLQRLLHQAGAWTNKQPMISILHVTPHLGGGVGRVLLNYLTHTFANDREQHSLVCLDYANPTATERAAAIGIHLEDRMAGLRTRLLYKMAQADIVVMHWWNHPLIYALMIREILPPTRLLLWSHVSGLFPTQNFTDELINYPDLFVVSSPVSFDAPSLKRQKYFKKNDKVRLIFSCAGIEQVSSAKPLPHENFTIGYIGTVDYCKMHPHFIQMSAASEIPGAKFVVCGGPKQGLIRQDAVKLGVVNRFDFLGHISDVASQLSTLDIFGYPLAPYHYGTGEQALIEALVVGIPPVVLGNGSEQHIVQNGITGIVAADEKAYSHALEQLYRQPDFRLFLSENARRIAREKYTIENLARSWSSLYEESMHTQKGSRIWPGSHGIASTDAELFLASLGEYDLDYSTSMALETSPKVFEADDRIANGGELFRSKTRGSVFHYHAFFPDDPWLNLWCGLIEFNNGNEKDACNHFMIASNTLSKARVAGYLERLNKRV
jgi:L-malate glycosyltransferase